MTRKLEWKAAAQVDLLEIVDHIGAENPDAASAFAQMVYAKVEALCPSTAAGAYAARAKWSCIATMCSIGSPQTP